jgi:hypothetical protein
MIMRATEHLEAVDGRVFRPLAAYGGLESGPAPPPNPGPPDPVPLAPPPPLPPDPAPEPGVPDPVY